MLTCIVWRVTQLLRPSAQGDETQLASPRGGRPQGPSTRIFSEVGRAALRAGTIPVRSAATIGRAMQLFVAVLRYSVSDSIALRLPVGELMVQAWTLLKVTATPAVLMAIPFGANGLGCDRGIRQSGGATALQGAASGVGVVRQGAPITAGLLMGGAAASAIASDFGARAVREELDAMRVIGVDPVRHLVVPRFLALLLIAPILCVFILVSGNYGRVCTGSGSHRHRTW